MKRCLCRLSMLAFALGLTLLSISITNANATLVTFEFTGTVQEVSNSAAFGGLSVGQTISGSYTFDSEATANYQLVAYYDFLGNPSTELSIDIGSLVFNVPFSIGISDDAVLGLSQDIYSVNSLPLEGFNYQINMEANGQPSGYITSQALPLVPLEVSGPQMIWNNINITQTDAYGFTTESLYASWDTLTLAQPVPEPSTTLLLGMGLIGFAVKSRLRERCVAFNLAQIASSDDAARTEQHDTRQQE